GRPACRLRSAPAARAAGGVRARDGLAQSAPKSGARGVAPGAGSRAWQHQPRRAQARRRPQHALPENASAAHQVASQEAAALSSQGGNIKRRQNGAVFYYLIASEKQNRAQGDDAVLVFTSGLVLGRRLYVFTHQIQAL